MLDMNTNDAQTKKSKAIFWLKMVSAIIAAVLATLGVTSVTSCSTYSGFSLSADTLYMDNPNISVVDSTRIELP